MIRALEAELARLSEEIQTVLSELKQENALTGDPVDFTTLNTLKRRRAAISDQLADAIAVIHQQAGAEQDRPANLRHRRAPETRAPQPENHKPGLVFTTDEKSTTIENGPTQWLSRADKLMVVVVMIWLGLLWFLARIKL
jgi:hypothetical protein